MDTITRLRHALTLAVEIADEDGSGEPGTATRPSEDTIEEWRSLLAETEHERSVNLTAIIEAVDRIDSLDHRTQMGGTDIQAECKFIRALVREPRGVYVKVAHELVPELKVERGPVWLRLAQRDGEWEIIVTERDGPLAG